MSPPMPRRLAARSSAVPAAGRFCIRAGRGEPLLLLHGVTGSARMWKHVVPLLAPHHDVIAPTALGHRGGKRAERRPVRVTDVVDDVERCIDEYGFDRVHLAGNSLGGWVALELARRGRGLSVCALSPAGVWEPGKPPADTLRAVVKKARAFRGLMPLLARLSFVRDEALRENALHGARVTRDELLEITDDLLGCTVREDLLDTPDTLEPLSAACPVTIAWAEHDRVFPPAPHVARTRELVPDAHFEMLEGVGHVPMFDDPELVARTILASVARARAA
jgi:pimeloyl-ACP methyl ester carboxylesterase